jgi:predicted unusual protein kinase regulating ubiquinone biosynthesis (AarF/ABC1/UbiB family)
MKEPRHKAVPASQLRRLGEFGKLAVGLGGNVARHGVGQLLRGNRPEWSRLLLTPANAHRLADHLSEMRGAALKLGQLLSMDTGDFIPAELTDILARLRADADPMPDRQLAKILTAQWGEDWQAGLSAFDARPIAAASIGQVHRGRARDGRDLAIKIQYPGIAQCIDSDVDNAALLLRATGLVPAHMDVAPLLAEAKRQLHEEADYRRELSFLERYAALLDGDERYRLPAVLPELSTDKILTMTFVPGVPIEQVALQPQPVRDRVAHDLMHLVLRELFEFGVMQSDPNLANFRYDPATGQIILLDFGATRIVQPAIAECYRNVLLAALHGDQPAMRAALENFGMLDAASSPGHVAAVLHLFDAVTEPLLKRGVFDFGDPGYLQSMRAKGADIFMDRSNWRMPPAEVFFVQRKLGGTFQLAAKLRSRVDVGALLSNFL